MISKGHDISNVTLVGILGVDNMLAMNDYMASEKAYSNISQVAGRAGRGDLSGRVIIPTSDLNNYILNAVIKGDYTEFYEKEIEYRKMFNYPPFTDIVLFELSSSNFNTDKNASCGISTFPISRIFFFPRFCFSSSFFFLVTSPP